MSVKQNNARLYPEDQTRLGAFMKANDIETFKEFVIFVLDNSDGGVVTLPTAPLSQEETDLPNCVFRGTHESLGNYVMCKGTKIHIAQCLTRQKRYLHFNKNCRPVETDKITKAQRRISHEEKEKRYTCYNCKAYDGCIRPEDGKAAMPSDFICEKFVLSPKRKFFDKRLIK